MKKIILLIVVLLCMNISYAQKTVQTLNYSHGQYVGEVMNGKANGQGTYTAKKTGTIYAGQFVNDTFSGQGTMIWKNGDKFVGAWQNDTGVSGVMTFANGKSISGKVVNGAFKEAGTSGNAFPKELIGNWGGKQGCIAEITKDTYEEGGGIIGCTLANVKTLDDGFSGTLNCSADGNAGKRSIKYAGGILTVDGAKLNRCRP